jgi:hypothetical protein
VCQAMFRDDPQVHVIGHWTYPAGTRKTVYVASNCQDVQLFVNGKSLGHGTASEHYLFTFPDVAWEPGEIKAVGYNAGSPAATNAVRTAGPPVALRLSFDYRAGRFAGVRIGHCAHRCRGCGRDRRALPDVPEARGFHLSRPGNLARWIQQWRTPFHQPHVS